MRRCESTDRLALLATNGRVYTVKAADLPRGRGDGQAIRLLIELGNDDGVVDLFIPDAAGKYLIAGSSGRGFLIPGSELNSERKAGKQILNLRAGEEFSHCVPAKGDHVAVIGENRKLLVFPLAGGAGDAERRRRGLAEIQGWGNEGCQGFTLALGLTWKLGANTRTETKLADWLGTRGQAGAAAPNGFPKSGKFGD